jgi:hypothetical protein
MIERLFSSQALYATLAIFFDYPYDPIFPRLICRQAGDGKCGKRVVGGRYFTVVAFRERARMIETAA